MHGRYAEAPNGATRLLTRKQPVGPTLMITPWNFPLAMGTRKIGPAVAAGCTMVVKPAQQTPLTMLLLAQVLQECGLPPGVLNVVTTAHTGAVMEPIIRDPVSYTHLDVYKRQMMTSQPIEQRRILRTQIPGPASQILHARKLAAVSAGVSTGCLLYTSRCV